MISIAIANQKGGVAKTTTVINLAAFWAKQGLRTMVVDLDGQGHVAPGFRQPKSNGLYRLIEDGQPVERVAQAVDSNLWIIPNDHSGEKVKQNLATANFKEYTLANLTAEWQDKFDLVIFDTPPSSDILHVMALVASDYVLIPTVLDFLGMDGVQYVLKTMRDIGRFPGVTPPMLLGVLPTMYDRTTGETVRNAKDVQAAVGAASVLPPIPRDTKIREASAYGQTIWTYAPNSVAAIGYAMSGAGRTNSRGRVGGYLHAGEIILDTLRSAAR
jgi:chromosome partitioning protein